MALLAPKKTSHFLDNLTDKLDSSWVLVPSAAHRQKLKSQLLTQVQNPSHLSSILLTGEDLCQHLLKAHHYRFHHADLEFCLVLLFALMTNQQFKILPQRDPLQRLQEIYQLFSQLRLSGLSLKHCQKTLNQTLNRPDLAHLLQSYEEHLNQSDFYDPARLWQMSLSGLTQNTLTWPHQKKHLFFKDIYPFPPGYRQFCKKLADHYPQLDIHIYYDEDFSRPDDWLTPVYEELGRLCDQTVDFTPHSLKHATLQEFTDPHHEATVFCQKIQQAPQPPWSQALVLPPNLWTLWQQHFEHHDIPVVAAFTTKVSDLLPKTMDLILSDRLQSKSKQGVLENRFCDQKQRAKHALQNFNQRFHFTTKVLEPLWTKLVKSKQNQIYQALKNNLRLAPSPHRHQLTLIAPQDVLAHDHKILWYAGLQDDAFHSTKTPSLYSPDLATQKDFAELTQSSSWLRQVCQERLRQSLLLTPSTWLSYAKTDEKGRKTSVLDLHDIQWHRQKHFDWSSSSQPRAIQNVSLKTSTRKLHFAITELELYQRCPFQYYAQKRLKLSPIGERPLDGQPQDKGSFIHHVLYILYQDHSSLWKDIVDHDHSELDIQQRLQTLLENQAQSFPAFCDHDPDLLTIYLQRAAKTLQTFLFQEAQWIREKCKHTQPSQFEWRIQNQNQSGFALDIADQTVLLTGQIDRIDIDSHQNEFSVIDYKTGDPPSLASIQRGDSLQLPLYIMAVQNHLGSNYKPSGAFYYGLKTNKISGFVIKDSRDDKLLTKRYQLSAEDWQDCQKTIKNQVQTLVTKIQDQDFKPQPLSLQICRFCDYKRICHYQASS